MAKKKTSTGTVSTKSGKLKIYSTTNANKKNKIGTAINGTNITIVETKIVSGSTWAKIKGDGINSGWVIMQAKGASTSAIDTSGTASQKKKRKTAESVSAAKNSADITHATITSTVQETTGVVRFGDNQYNTGEVTTSIGALPDFKDKNPIKTQLSDEEIAAGKELDFQIKYDSQIEEALNVVRHSLNIYNDFNPQKLFTKYTEYYNRFKIPFLDDIMVKSFSHVFFTRPDCNIMSYSGNESYTLMQSVQGIDPYQTAFRNNIGCMKQLISQNEYTHDFMLYPSNKIIGFDSRDKTLSADTYGRTLQGHSIAYGKHLVASKAASELSLTFNEDRYYHIYNLHNLWVNYIADAYTGRVIPDDGRILNKELDYAAALYYFVTDETGENIVYWSKYYGIFPTTIPDSVASWNKGQVVTNPEVTISYQYSFREDCDVRTLYDFNLNARNAKNWKYARTYEPDIASTGTTWVGTPFVEMVQRKNGSFVFKLRFLEKAI